MIMAPVSHHRADRLEAVPPSCILDTDPEHDFDDLANLTSRLSGASIELVGLSFPRER
jgi:hypothetical protein